MSDKEKGGGKDDDEGAISGGAKPDILPKILLHSHNTAARYGHKEMCLNWMDKNGARPCLRLIFVPMH